MAEHCTDVVPTPIRQRWLSNMVGCVDRSMQSAQILYVRVQCPMCIRPFALLELMKMAQARNKWNVCEGAEVIPYPQRIITPPFGTSTHTHLQPTPARHEQVAELAVQVREDAFENDTRFCVSDKGTSKKKSVNHRTSPFSLTPIEVRLSSENGLFLALFSTIREFATSKFLPWALKLHVLFDRIKWRIEESKWTTILDLNDHVLLETFRNLGAGDVCAIADVCSTFKRNAQAEFMLWNKNLNFSTSAECNLHIRQLAPALRNFASSTAVIGISLTPAHRNQSPHVLKLIIKYCGVSLNELKLECVDFSASMVLKMSRLLSRPIVRSNWNQPRRKCFHSGRFCSESHTRNASQTQIVARLIIECCTSHKSIDHSLQRHNSDHCWMHSTNRKIRITRV